ncbi:hypothetical protein NL676_021517 [Syzygium grande]|nr:hypothetical protein NL676_021517 [Syzygium grande]
MAIEAPPRPTCSFPMEWNKETLQFLSPFPVPRRQPESSLADAANRPGYALAVLCLVAEPSVDEQIRQAVVVNFKNHLRARWASTPTTHNAAVDADADADADAARPPPRPRSPTPRRRKSRSSLSPSCYPRQPISRHPWCDFGRGGGSRL